jgi:uncharacterized phage-associated protein/DNA-binding transcriptional regulator YiaG
MAYKTSNFEGYYTNDLDYVDAKLTKIIEEKETHFFGEERTEVSLVVPRRVVGSTGEVVNDPDLDNWVSERFLDELRRITHALMPEDIKAIRTRIGISQRGLANLVGWSSATIERYERGGSVPTKVNESILKSLEDGDNLKRFYASSDKTKYSNKDFKVLSERFDDKDERAEFLYGEQVAKWFIAENQKEILIDPENSESLTQMAVQKLVYFSQVFYLGRFDKLLIEEEVQAWKFGPVFASIRNDFDYVEGPVKREFAFTDDELRDIMLSQKEIDANREVREVLNDIWGIFGKYRTSELMHLTHLPETAWSYVYDGSLNRSIPNGEIKRDYQVFGKYR